MADLRDGNVWFYSVPETSGDLRHRYESSHRDRGFVAEECADQYFAECDGWDDTWPLVFVLFETEEGPEVARFTVEREDVPTFNATEITDGG